VRACRRIGQQLGVNPETLRGWVTPAEIDDGQRPGTATSDAARVAELEREEAQPDPARGQQAEQGGPNAWPRPWMAAASGHSRVSGHAGRAVRRPPTGTSA
jgi:transposase-like protein